MARRCGPQMGVDTFLRCTQCLWYFFIVLSAFLVVSPSFLNGFVILFSQEAQIVSKELYSGTCVDGSEWKTSSGSCDKIVCHVEPSGTYFVSHSCRPREPYENPDTANCEWQSNSSQTFPGCCPTLQCGESSPLTTISPSVCRDIAQNFACVIWKNLTSGCSDPGSDVYEIAQTYCNHTCGIC